MWQLIAFLEQKGVLCSLEIKDALLKIDRKKFIPAEYKEYAYTDEALPIGWGQTISQPSTVVFMLELLKVKEGDKVLDIGAGTGWASCLLGELAGESGHVYAFEINKKIGEKGMKNVEKWGEKNITYRIIDAGGHWHEYAKYDKIHCAAAFGKIPEDLVLQLKIKGILVAPTKDGNMWKITRTGKNKFERENFYGFAFVPFVEQEKKVDFWEI